MVHVQRVGIFPASGGIGGSTVKHILPRLPPHDLVFIARSPSRLSAAADKGVTVRGADYDNDEHLKAAFEGIDVLFLISYASSEYEHRVERHRFAIDCALRSGVKYIFYGSLGYAGREGSRETVAHVMKAHVATEYYLEELHRKDAAFNYTIIREGLYAESYPLYTAFFDPAKPVGEIKIPHNGSGPGISWVKREELGEGTAELLRRFINGPESFQYKNKTVLLSGSTALTLQESVDVLGKIAKHPVRIVQVTDDEFADQPVVSTSFIYRGVNLSKPWASAFEAFRRGEAARVSPLLKELLGREPEDFETTVRASLVDATLQET